MQYQPATPTSQHSKRDLINDVILRLYETNAIKFGTFTLKSGIESPVYIDMRLVMSYPQVLQTVAELMADTVIVSDAQLVCGVPYGAVPTATVVSLAVNRPLIMVRKAEKNHGAKRMVEGVFEKGQTCTLIEDVMTTGGSALRAIDALKNEEIKVKDVVVFLDREQGGRDNLEKQGYRLHAVCTLNQALNVLHDAGKIERETIEAVRNHCKQII